MKSLERKCLALHVVACLFIYTSTIITFDNQSYPAQLAHVTKHFLPLIAHSIKQFKRPITVLEIGTDEVGYTFSLMPCNNLTGVIMLLKGGVEDVVQRVKKQQVPSICVLAPLGARCDSLQTLSRCEHFDIVIVHDISSFMRASSAKLVDVLVNLGDRVYMKTTNPDMIHELKKRKLQLLSKSGEMCLFVSRRAKTSLDIARFTQKHKPINLFPKYHIKSSLTHKFFHKDGLAHSLTWIDGINLVTFAMLKGVYPTDAQIREQITVMKTTHPGHNDLVLGNMIVQGSRLVPIDLNDSRRDADINLCINAALKAFQMGNKRLITPQKWIEDYYHSV